MTLTLENSDLSPVSCRVDDADLPEFVTGMFWRSFKTRSTPNSRLNTST